MPIPLQSTYDRILTEYIKPDDIDFPVSKIRLFVDMIWNTVTNSSLTQEQKKTLKDLIDILNLLDEHKHENQRELIQTMLPSIAPLLGSMPTLASTAALTFTTLVPTYQYYLSNIEAQVKEAHAFSLEETLLYYEVTIFDHLFLLHMFEQDQQLNLIEILHVLKVVVITNALVYDYHQHAKGKSISFFTFLERGGTKPIEHYDFLLQAIERIKEDSFSIIDHQEYKDVIEFLVTKLIETTKAKQKEETIVLSPDTTKTTPVIDTLDDSSATT